MRKTPSMNHIFSHLRREQQTAESGGNVPLLFLEKRRNPCYNEQKSNRPIPLSGFRLINSTDTVSSPKGKVGGFAVEQPVTSTHKAKTKNLNI